MNKAITYTSLFFLIISCGVKVKEVDFSKAPKNTKELISKVSSKNKIQDWLTLKGKVEFKKEDKDLTLNINITHRKDSLIRASVAAPFGIELFRIAFTKDSIYFINHTDKTFFIRPMIDASTVLKTEISFDEIQEMITSNPRFLKKKYKFRFAENTFELNGKQVFYRVSADFYRVLSGRIINGESEFSYEFSSFINQNNILFPKNLLIRVSSSSENFEAKLTYSKIVFNQKQKTSFKIPISYVKSE